MVSKHLASVIVPTKNGGDLFRDVLSTVLAQETTFDFDVLVIDSGSKDGTVEFIDSIEDARVRLLRIQPSDFGHGRTRNLGVASTNGKYAVLITHDACPADKQWLQNLVALAESNERIAGVFGRHIAYPGANPFVARDLDLHFQWLAQTPLARIEDRARYDADVGYRQFLHFFSDNNALIRRSVWEELPYPDVDFAEDQLWAKKAVEAGWLKGYAHDAVVYHSHNYGLWERLQRSFDESCALYRHFGYVLCPTIRGLWQSFVAASKRDIRYTLDNKLQEKNLFTFIRAPLDNFMRQIGYYLGPRAWRFPPLLISVLSLDRRLFEGKKMSSGKRTGQRCKP
jgi:rhamnosyltransferase